MNLGRSTNFNSCATNQTDFSQLKSLLSRVALVCGLTFFPTCVFAQSVTLLDENTLPTIVHDDTKTATLAAEMLAHDIKSLTGQSVALGTSVKNCQKICIVIGENTHPLMQTLYKTNHLNDGDVAGRWEVYERTTLQADGKTIVVINGSDPRGMIYGVVDLTRELGVSAWEWWADVTPRHVSTLAISASPAVSKSPSVRYRGIFLNDEDWGLEPWAAQTVEPETGNIGPKTYKRVFELMWRLKANTLWPAMHTISTPFYGDLRDPALADDYAIVIGTSHAEPVMRNNLREWDAKVRGPFNFKENRKGMIAYWTERARQSSKYENLYTIGLRGIHDGPMQGATTMAERTAVLEEVIALQRQILSKTFKKKPEQISQVYVAYHELQEAIDAGLHLPDDVTIMWADDNYGYIRRLNTPAEAKRSGGSGVYYHLSYWGRPHDYLWLGTTAPTLIHEEMSKALNNGADRIWIANVGDIKPNEYLTQYFLDLAFDSKTFRDTPRQHLTQFMGDIFGANQADKIADIMFDYYDLAFERKPEFMGFGQTEWVNQNRPSAYIAGDGEEAQRRVAAYADIVLRAEAIYADLPEDRKAAYFELVLYPVRGAAKLNERILKLDLANLYAGQDRASANHYVAEAQSAHATIVNDTATYNGLNNGKWRHMMDMAPRKLPVFDEPLWPTWSESKKPGCGISLSGQWYGDENALVFVAGKHQQQSLTLFGHNQRDVQWQIDTLDPAFALSQTKGSLSRDNRYEARLKLAYDGTGGPRDLHFDLICDGTKIPVFLKIFPAPPANMIFEQNRIITLLPSTATYSADWEILDGLGRAGHVARTQLSLNLPPKQQGSALEWTFYNQTSVGGKIKIVGLPSYALNPNFGLKAGVQLDDGPVQIIDFSTLGRSDQWRQNVLDNASTQSIDLRTLPAGTHKLRIFAMDPGLMIDHIEVNLDGAPKHYGIAPTTVVGEQP